MTNDEYDVDSRPARRPHQQLSTVHCPL